MHAKELVEEVTRPKKKLIHGYRRGNTTSGPDRRGNREGRKPIYAADTALHHISLNVSEPEYVVAMRLGAGKAAQGARQALLLAAASLPPGGPQTRTEAYAAAVAARKARSTHARTLARLAAARLIAPSIDRTVDDWDDVTHPPVDANEPPV